ncbi:hypothetical protein BCF74_11263 [Knoellia remsis]|uniref:Uncharacterized protein n=1 Tax=Knoellia remsis TaxID=407159 RepID=A0A2T0UK37_9MICO|nr:hypothetical protein [Knoellia remsis]PRY58246.1 hypothetical protein BCF74_11263 [Knoellia remsis]
MSGNRTVHRLGRDGAVLDWLVGPVWEAPCLDLGSVVPADGSPWDDGGRLGRWRLTNGPDVAPVKDALYAVVGPSLPVAPWSPPEFSEDGDFRWPTPFPASSSPAGGPERELQGTWERHRTAYDGVVERSTFCYTPTYRAFVAATRLEVDQPEVRRLVVRSTGPLRVWLRGELVLEHPEFGYMQPWTQVVETLLPSGTSDLVVASWNVALREVRQTVSVHVEGLPVRVVIPSAGADESRDAVAEGLLDAVTVRQWEATDGSATLHGPPGLRVRVHAGRHEVGAHTFDDAGVATVPLVAGDADSEQASMLGTGEISLTVRVDDPACRSRRDLLVGHLPWRQRHSPEAGPDTWRTELLTHAAGRGGSARALAEHALDPSASGVVVTADALAPALGFITSRSDCADFEAVGLMLLWHRVPAERWAPGTRDSVREALLDFKYWIDQPGTDAMCYFTENHQMVWHTAETLVGETFSRDKFTNTGWTGAEHADHGRDLAKAWVDRKLTSGFSEFDSNAYLAIDALALVALVDHAADGDLRRRAEALLDKILLTLASNSWRGTHGSAHGRSYTPTLRASCLEETAGIMWALWGMGALNEATLPATALATSTAYALPEVIRAIASEPDADWTGTQSYRGEYAMERDLLTRGYSSRVVVRRGRGGMVSSVQDYRVGLPGLQEHVWGVTLPGAVQVWATNPAAVNHGSHTRPSGWVGHRVLPRVRQHDRTVIALHRGDTLAEHVHLWFPAARLDEWRVDGDWLVGRKGEGFVAVATPGGFEPVRAGDEAWQSWLPRQAPLLVAVHADDAMVDGLDAFVAGLPELEWRPGDTAVRVGPSASSADAPVELAWDGPFLVNDRPVDVADGVPVTPPHLDNRATRVAAADDLVSVTWGGHLLEIDPVAGRRRTPASGIRDEGVDGTDGG